MYDSISHLSDSISRLTDSISHLYDSISRLYDLEEVVCPTLPSLRRQAHCVFPLARESSRQKNAKSLSARPAQTHFATAALRLKDFVYLIDIKEKERQQPTPAHIQCGFQKVIRVRASHKHFCRGTETLT